MFLVENNYVLMATYDDFLKILVDEQLGGNQTCFHLGDHGAGIGSNEW